MSAVRRKMGGAAKKPAKLKTLLLGSFGAGFALILLIVFFLPSASKTRSASRTRTTVQAPLRRAAPNPAASGVAGVAARAPAMASSRGAVASSTAPSEKELALIASMEQLAKSGKIDQAITQLERETGANPFLARALFTLATLYQKKNLLDKATATLMRVLQVEPKNPLAYNNLGLIQLRLKRFNEAVVFLEKACENAQGTPEPWLNMGIAYEQKLRWSDSVRAYERYVRLMSTDHAKTIRSVNDEKIISAVNIRLLRLRAFSAADDRKIASIGEDGEDDEDEQKENEPEDPRTAAETQLKAGESEIDPIPIVQKMTGGRAKLAAPPESAKPEKSRSPAGAPFEPSPGASP